MGPCEVSWKLLKSTEGISIISFKLRRGLPEDGVLCYITSWSFEGRRHLPMVTLLVTIPDLGKENLEDGGSQLTENI